MSDKFQLASYLSSLISIMESKEDAGIPRGPTLGREYDRAYTQLREILDKEHEDEARKRSEQRRGYESGTQGPRH